MPSEPSPNGSAEPWPPPLKGAERAFGAGYSALCARCATEGNTGFVATMSDSERAFCGLCWDLLYQATAVLPPARSSVLVRTIQLWHPCARCAIHYQSLVENPLLDWDLINADRWCLARFVHEAHNVVNRKRNAPAYPWGAFVTDMEARGMPYCDHSRSRPHAQLEDHLKKINFGAALPLMDDDSITVRLLERSSSPSKHNSPAMAKLFSQMAEGLQLPAAAEGDLFSAALSRQWPVSLTLENRLKISRLATFQC
jgi:hypothetical protein